MKNMWKYIFAASIVGTLGVLASCGISGTDATNSITSSYVQIERLGRPAVNEGLVLSNANLNAFNSIPPSLDGRSDIAAVAAVQGEAVTVLSVVRAIGVAAGQTPPLTTDVAGQFLPDVTRISVDDAHYLSTGPYSGGFVANADRTSNSRQGEVGYTACLGGAGFPLLCGGRKIRDDVIDVTLSYIAVGGIGGAIPGASGSAIVSYPVSDAISYSTSHPASQPLLSTFPFLARPL